MPVWREITGFSGYFISDDAVIKRAAMTHEYRSPQTDKIVRRSYPEKIMKQSSDRDGYAVAGMTGDDGIRRQVRVHRVLLAEFEGDGGCLMACHKDGDKTNNSLDNLYWGTAQDNMDDCVRHGNRPTGADHPCAKLSVRDVEVIRGYEKHYGYRQVLSEMFGVYISTIDKIRRGETHASC